MIGTDLTATVSRQGAEIQALAKERDLLRHRVELLRQLVGDAAATIGDLAHMVRCNVAVRPEDLATARDALEGALEGLGT